MKTEFQLEVNREHKRLLRLAFPERELEIERRWKSGNPDKVKEIQRWRWAKHKESEYARTRDWMKAHPEKAKEYAKRQRGKDPEGLKRRKREEYRRNRSAYIERSIRWSRNNPIKKRNYYLNRTKQISDEGSENCSNKIKLLALKRFCHWCCCSLTKLNFTVDHVIPLMRGGFHKPDNLVAACKSCNCSKGDKLVEEWTWKEAA